MPIVRFQLDTKTYEELKKAAKHHLQMERGAISVFCRKIILDNLGSYQPDVVEVEPPEKRPIEARVRR